MTEEVFDQTKAEPKYELYDVNSLYPEKWDRGMDWTKDRHGLDIPTENSTAEDWDVYWREYERLNALEDLAWKNRHWILKFFFGVGVLMAVPVVAKYFLEEAVDIIKDKFRYLRKNS